MYEFMRVSGIVLMTLAGVGAIVTLTLWVWASMFKRGLHEIHWDIHND